MYSIYALVDPRDHTTRYVGVTQDVYERFIQHIRCDGSNARKDAWIQELKAANKMVIMTTLQDVSSAVLAKEREVYWMHHFLELGTTLYNSSIPNPLHLRRHGQPIRIKKSQDAEIPIESKTEAVHELRQSGYSPKYIIKKVWGVVPGQHRYSEARSEFYQIVGQHAPQDKRELVRELRRQGCNTTEIFYQVWGVTKGVSIGYAQARQEYNEIIAQINMEDQEGG